MNFTFIVTSLTIFVQRRLALWVQDGSCGIHTSSFQERGMALWYVLCLERAGEVLLQLPPPSAPGSKCYTLLKGRAGPKIQMDQIAEIWRCNFKKDVWHIFSLKNKLIGAYMQVHICTNIHKVLFWKYSSNPLFLSITRKTCLAFKKFF